MSFDINFADEDYNDAHGQQIYEWVETIFDEFLDSKHFKALTETQKQHSFFLLMCFFTNSYTYCLTGPGAITREVVHEICLDVFPRKVSAEKEAFESFEPVMIQFLLWCEEKKYMKSTETVRYYVKEVAPQMVVFSQEPSKWGMTKSFFGGML